MIWQKKRRKKLEKSEKDLTLYTYGCKLYLIKTKEKQNEFK